MPSLNSYHVSLFEHVFKRQPNFSFLKVFGCQFFPHLRPYNQHKMNFRSTLCVFVGYSSSLHDYRCLDLTSEKLYIPCHVQFHETYFPFLTPKTKPFTSPSSDPYVSTYSLHIIFDGSPPTPLLSPPPSLRSPPVQQPTLTTPPTSEP
ncbi:unnamed protein product [Lactuca virosa]|uniref:Retroviral polymerase SH3-like domain-containing protein n=1 Tax=Lactuca virosa TaxID=75947 RepID=A0AAU9LKI2_9ASTR|nr:unnamed protein product [Lactuca virosa]